MRTPVTVIGLFVTLFVTVAPAPAQPRWDGSGLVGGWWGQPALAETPARYDDEWFGSWLGSVSVGRYWTDHIKTEIDATFTSAGERYVSRQVQLPGERTPRYFSAEERWHERSVAALVTLQAGRNWWVHPFLQGGVSVDWESMRSEMYSTFSTPPPIGVPGVEVRDESRQVTRGVVGGGAKFYMSERAFFRADLRTSFGGGATHVQFRTGFGFDF